MSIDIAQLLELPVSDRLEIIEQLWDSIAADGETMPVPEWQKQELAERKARLKEDPNRVSDWEDALDRLGGREE